jgi:heavy metal translocating P-type ATPase
LVNTPETCALCGLKIDGPPVAQTFDGEEKHFCCQGCARVYQVARENDMLDEVVVKPKPRQSVMTDLMAGPGKTSYFTLDGMWCAGCAVAAEQVLRSQPGVKGVDVSFAAERGRLHYDPQQVDPAAALRGLDALGYRARLLADEDEGRSGRQQERTLLQLIVAMAFGMQVMFLYIELLYPRYAAGQFTSLETRRIQYLAWLLATPVLMFGGSSFLRGAWRALRARTATMDTLVALGTLSAYVYSVYVALTGSGEAYFDSVAMITTFVMIGRFLEVLGGARARKDVRRLLSLQPDKAWRRQGESWEAVQASALVPGDTIMVKPGERVPADAEVVEGAAALDESLLTGESVPVDREAGDEVFAGTVVADDTLICRVTRAVRTTRLAQITQLVEQTLSAKPPVQRLADKASAYFAFGIVGVAVLTFLGWWLAGSAPVEALLHAIAVLVVACPCALGLATPLALAVTLGRTTRQGILIRNLGALETVTRVNRIVFDKTGTLTRGSLTIVETRVDSASGVDSQKVLCLAAAVEQYSEHPIAKTITAACDAAPPPSGEFQALRGMGVSARVGENGGRRVLVGSSRLLGVGPDSELVVKSQEHGERGETVVWVGWDDVVAGFVALRDEPEPTASEALSQLKQDGILPVMLSGDNPQTTSAIAQELGLTEFEGGCPPADKAERIRQWQTAGERVVMVGDGVNDAPALAQADLSITVAGGADVAGETSDVVLTRSDLALIPWFIHTARRTRGIIRQNLAWAFAYNLVAVPLAAFGIISPVIAAVAMAASSLLVVGNSLRLSR